MRKCFRSLVCLVVLLFASFNLEAVMYIGNVVGFKQPDGSTVKVRLYGNDFYVTGESLDGYTVVRDEKTGWISYAITNSNASQLISTGVFYKESTATAQTLQKLPTGIKKNMRLSKTALKEKIDAVKSKLGPRTSVPSGLNVSKLVTGFSAFAATTPYYQERVGSYKGLLVCVEFPDQPAVIPVSEIDNFANQLGYSNYGNNGSVRDYYKSISNNNLDYTNVVAPIYYMAQHPKATYYEDVMVSSPIRSIELANEVLSYLNANNFDFTAVSRDASGEAYALNIMYAGDALNWSYGLWPVTTYLDVLGGPAFVTHDGITFNHFMMTNIGQDLKIGTFCHENGHMLMNWEDCYDYYNGPDSLGYFCLMAAGSNAGPGYDGSNPIPVNAYFKYVSGWETVTEINSSTCGTLPAISGNNTCYIYRSTARPTEELFVIENRQQTGRDLWLPSAGLAIWHIDQTLGYHDYWYWMLNPNYHYQVQLEEADGRTDLEMYDAYWYSLGYFYGNTGDALDLFKSGVAGCASIFNSSSAPNSNWWTAGASGLSMSNISASSNAMSFDLQACPFTFTPTFSYTYTPTPTFTATPCVSYDTAFGNGGFVSNNNAAGGNGNDFGYASVVDPYGKIYVTGVSDASEGYNNMVIWRYNANGTLDTTYGPSLNGMVNYDPSYEITAWGRALALDINGRLIVTGNVVLTGGHNNTFVSRYNSNGTLDTTFNGTGTLMLSGVGGYGVLVDPNQRIVIAARISDTLLQVARINDNGTLDGSFGGGTGFVNFAGGSADYSKIGITQDNLGQIYITDTKNSRLAIWRFHGNGAAGWSATATTYGAYGVTGIDKGNTILLSPTSGQAYISGTSISGTNSTMFISRVNMMGGIVDTTFGSGGFVSFNGIGANSYGNDFKFNMENDLVITGAVRQGPYTDTAVWKYSQAGNIDYTFAPSGYIIGGHASFGMNQGNSVITAHNGNILVAGYTRNAGNNDMALWSFNDACAVVFPPLIYTPVFCVTPNATFNTNGYVTERNALGGTKNDAGNAICTDPSGANIYVAGQVVNTYGNDNWVVWKYNSSGVKDMSFVVNNGGSSMAVEAMDLKADSTGVVVVGKHSDRGGLKIRVSRYTTAGALVWTTYVPGEGYSMEIDPSGRIIVVGKLNNTTLRLIRLTAAGVLDTSFSGDGIYDFQGGITGDVTKMGLFLQPGQIIVTNSFNNDLAVWRFTDAGIPDTTFAGTGRVVVSDIIGVGAIDKGTGVVVIPTGNIFVTGSSKMGGNETMFLLRLGTTGNLLTLGEEGSSDSIVRFNYAGKSRGNYLMLDNSNNLIITGCIQKGTVLDMCVWRYNTLGRRDLNFNYKGFVYGDKLTSTLAEGFDAVISPTGKMYISGMTKHIAGDNDMAVWAYDYICGSGSYSPSPIMPATSELPGTLSVSKSTPVVNEKYVTLDKKETYFYPNPSKGSVTIRFPLSVAEETNIRIFDINGKTVWNKTIGAGSTKAGINSLIWDAINDNGSKVSNGVYYITIGAGDMTITKKAVILK